MLDSVALFVVGGKLLIDREAESDHGVERADVVLDDDDTEKLTTAVLV